MGNEQFQIKFKALQKRFVNALPDDLATMQQCLKTLENTRDAQVIETFLFIAHRYSGNGETFGFPAISQAARQLETSLRAMKNGQESKLSEIATDMNALENAFLTVTTEL